MPLRRALVAVAWFVGLTFAVSDAFWAGAFDWWDSAPLAAVAIVTTSALVSLALWGDERGLRALWLGAAATTPLVCAWAVYPYTFECFGAPWSQRFFDPWTRFLMEHRPPDHQVLGLVPAALALGAAGSLVPGRAVVWAARVAVVCGCVLLVASAARALVLPTPDGYLASLESHELRTSGPGVSGVFPNTHQIREYKLIGGLAEPVPTVPGVETPMRSPTLPSFEATRRCVDQPPYEGEPAARVCTIRVDDDVVAFWKADGAEPRVTRRFDRRSGLVFVVRGESVAVASRDGAELKSLTWAEIAAALSPPRGWLARAGLGWGVAVVVLAALRRPEAALAIVLLTSAPLAVGLVLALR
jgi:hypothetical protein